MSDGYIYFLQQKGTNLVKIGKAKDLELRTSNIIFHAREACISLSLIYSYPCENRHREEKRAHGRYADYFVNGEWFRLPDEIIEGLNSENEKKNGVLSKNNWGVLARECADLIGGVSALSKKLNVHRNLIHGWIRGAGNPNAENAQNLRSIYSRLVCPESDDIAT